jgi:outer membrane murein-binding lipoprotein Lpp
MSPRRAVVVRRRRPLLRTAVIGGGAYMAGSASARRKDAAATQSADKDAQTNQQGTPDVPSQRPAESPMTEQLDRLTAMHQQGALSDAEFSAAKAKLLGT